jgi:ATP-dependent Lon protease
MLLDIPSTDDTFYVDINKTLPIGSANGLAYVNDGYGAILKIQFVKRTYNKPSPKSETNDSSEEKSGHGSFTHTGRLGEVMKESTEVVKIAAFNFLQEQNLCKDFDKDHYHLHVPMGATPKDGPSAGTSLFASLMSSALNKPVAANLAMTGEITTYGEVISIGGVREKLTACKNHNVTRVVLPLSNKKNVKKLPAEFKTGFTIYYVTNIKQLHGICFPAEDTQSESDLNARLEAMGVEIE